MFVCTFDHIGRDDGPRVGAKGLRLAQLAQAGLPVPPGFCVTTAAYRAFLAANGLDSDREIADPDALLAAQVPPEVARAVEEAYHAFPVAVRSSATAEDLPDASFAGQYDTFLNVTTDGAIAPLLAAIRACWAGVWNERACAYAARHGLTPRQLQMAVVVQRQVAAQAAGVLFTLNPLTGREEEMLIEAVWGLGEPLVSGEAVPDRYVVNPYDRRVVRWQVTDQPTMQVAAPGGGTEEIAVPDEQRERPVLDQAHLLALAELGCQVQALYGYPQDVEWALADGRLFLLQTRPLTAFHFDPQLGQWTSANYREVLPGFASPLSLSISLEREYGRALATMFRDIKMGEAPSGTVMGRPFFGRAYWNVGAVKQFVARIPGFKERTFDATVGIEPAYEGDGLTTPWTPRTILRALPVLLALQRRYDTCWREAAAFAERFCHEEEPLFARVNPTALSDAELAAWVRRAVDLHERTNHVAITVSLLAAQAQDEFAPLLARLNRDLPPQEAIPFGDLLTGLGDVGTAKPMFELWELARRAQADTAIKTALTEGQPGSIAQRLQATPAGQDFWREVEAFIQRYHYMCRVDEDLAEPRWDEDPLFALATLQAYARRAEGQEIAPLLAVQRERAQGAETKAMAILSRGWRRVWPFARRSFQQQLERVRRYVWWREEMRVVASRAFYHARRSFLELGHRWATAGWLREPDEVFLLRWDDVQAALKGQREPQAIRRAIDRYLRLRTAYRNFEPPSAIGRGACLATPAPEERTCLAGTPCSSGRATGPVRVVRSLEEARALQEGEILVAPYTNPGWTPLFNLVIGLVIEAGGLLSHGAVVAREYGIPTVVGLERATRLLRTGQVIAIDGAAGTVEIVG